ncbi:MAG: hypothetical protein ACM3ML_20495 [Micromonosporaceae bacterium]
MRKRSLDHQNAVRARVPVDQPVPLLSVSAVIPCSSPSGMTVRPRVVPFRLPSTDVVTLCGRNFDRRRVTSTVIDFKRELWPDADQQHEERVDRTCSG